MNHEEELPNSKDCLEIYQDRSRYIRDEEYYEFPEGPQSEAALLRLKTIKHQLETGYLESIISGITKGNVPAHLHLLPESIKTLIKTICDSVTSGSGRALVGLSILQLVIKSICPEQNIRLHKGNTQENRFSWTEGISMRNLDKHYITPCLRKHDLLLLNSDGFMMTRTLAENYPYTKLYKAQIKGAMSPWLKLVNQIEAETFSPEAGLAYFITQLHNRTNKFQTLVTSLDEMIAEHVSIRTISTAQQLIDTHIKESDYAARLFEIAVHSFVNVLVASDYYDGLRLSPLTQMRSANKKHGNVGDVELLEGGKIAISIDAKYEKSYLREELEECAEKFKAHSDLKTFIFISSIRISRLDEMLPRILELEEEFQVNIRLVSWQDWIDDSVANIRRLPSQAISKIADDWFKTYAGYICQKFRDIAPIDEPCHHWVENLRSIISKEFC